MDQVPPTLVPIAQPSSAYTPLVSLDHEIHSRIARFVELVKQAESLPVSSASTVVASLREIFDWIATCASQLDVLHPTDHATKQLQTAMLDNLSTVRQYMYTVLKVLEDRDGNKPSEFHGGVVYTGISIPLYIVTLFDTKCRGSPEEYFQHPLDRVNPLIVVFLYLTIVLNLLGHLAETWCNLTLRLLQLAIQTIDTSPQSSINRPRPLQDIPHDIRSVRAIFNLEAKTITYATCPQCCCTYEPTTKNGIPIYPSHCTFRAFPSSEPCGAKLTTTGVHNRTSIRVPIRPFVIQCPESFIASMLSRPGMEEALSSTLNFGQSGSVLTDIGSGQRIQALVGPDDRPFLDAPADELRLMWTVAVDWFNPFYNKAAGKSASIGSITFACLNLPPSLRYKPENLYLAGIIPGPREPDYDQINHFLAPIVRRFLPMWLHGSWFTRTARYPRGRLSRSAIAALVCDLLGSRKASGHAHPSMRWFCSRCFLDKASINDLNRDTWKRRTWTDILQTARTYRDAPNQSERSRVFKEHGVRWSAFMELPYWDNTTSVVLDGMHNFFPGQASHHVRVVLGLDILALDPEKEEHETPVNINLPALYKAYHEILEGTVTTKRLMALNISTMVALHDELGIPLPGNFTSSTKGAKKLLVSSIFVSHDIVISSLLSDWVQYRHNASPMSPTRRTIHQLRISLAMVL